jgi:glycosyltransferase involved in cell wall biosynthesis
MAVRWVVNNADCVTAISSDTKKNAEKYYGIRKNIVIIPIPYEPIEFAKTSRKQLGLEKGKRYIIGIGRLVKRKGFDYFIDTIAGLTPDYEGIILGEGPERKNLENQAANLNISGRIHLPGFVTEEKKFQYLDNSDIYFLSSQHEGFGIVLQEAMQVRLPIISTDHGGQIDLIEEGRNGYLVSFNDIKGTIEKIKNIDKLKAYKYDNFSPAAIASKFIDLGTG